MIIMIRETMDRVIVEIKDKETMDKVMEITKETMIKIIQEGVTKEIMDKVMEIIKEIMDKVIPVEKHMIMPMILEIMIPDHK